MKYVRSKYMRPVAVLGAMLMSVSCTDLSENPVTEITEVTFDPTEEDLPALMGGVYENMRGWFMSWYGYVDIAGETGDILLTPKRPNGWEDAGAGLPYRNNHQHTWTTTRGNTGSAWGRSFDLIVETNRLINWVETGYISLDAATAEATIAEVRALRAYAYSIVLDWYGNAPISTDFTDSELPEQADRQQLYDFVVQELTEVIPELSEDNSPEMYGRINKWAALGILARVQLNAEVYTGTPAYNEVIALTDQIINSGLYQLASDYRAPFARDNHTSVETIWTVPYDGVSTQGGEGDAASNFHMKTLKPDLEEALNLNTQPWGGSASNPQFIDTYDEDDQRLEDTWLMGPVFSDDGRFGYDFVQHVPGMQDAAGDPVEFHHGFPVWKYEIYSGMTGASDVDYPILRYAEVLMMKAEALLRTGDAGAAAVLVTQVRQRAFKDTNPAKATVTGAELLGGSSYNYGWYDRDGVVKTGPGGTPVENGGADIRFGRFLDELGWEFAVEAHRRRDLIRFGVFTTKPWFNHQADVERVGDASYLRLMPIPQDALDANPNLTQNPGY